MTSLVDLPEVGSVIAGKFRLEKLIGEGGQAFVWRARHLELDTTVALKILRFNHAERTQAERLRKEARAVARINHPSIVRVFDLGETPQGNPYFAMEYLDGESLADALARAGRMTPIAAVQLLLPIASAVAAVHAVGVVHRDLKPDNAFLARSAHVVQPKLIDFGVAKYDVRKSRPIRLTDVGAVLGSPAYLSPEQARGWTDIDERADIWSFCVVLYECITGVVPFRAANTHALLFSIAEDAPPSLADLGIEEPELWQILRRGLEKAPVDRWPSMRALGRALARWILDRGVNSDVTGTLLEPTWFNPELVTPPPLGTTGNGPSSSEAPAWTRHAEIASHIARRIGSPRSVSDGLGPLKLTHRGFIASITFVVGMVATAFLFTHTWRGVGVSLTLQHWTGGALNPDDAALPLGVPFSRLGATPNRLAPDRLMRENNARLPAIPVLLQSTPVVSVESLRLVTGNETRQLRPTQRPLADNSPEIPTVVLESTGPTQSGESASH